MTTTNTMNVDPILGWSAPHIHTDGDALRRSADDADYEYVRVTETINGCRYTFDKRIPKGK